MAGSSAATPREAVQHGLLGALLAAAGLALVGGVFFGLWHIATVFQHPFAFHAAYAAPGWPEVASASPTAQFYGEILVETGLPLVTERLLEAASVSLPYLTVIVGAVGVIVLARRLMTSRPFARPARVLLFALSASAAALAVLAPWLSSLAAASAIRALGMPTNGSRVPDPDLDAWVSPTSFGTQDVDWPLLTIAVVLFLVALLWRHAARFQKDTEGLV
jgi:hypothetical protein